MHFKHILRRAPQAAQTHTHTHTVKNPSILSLSFQKANHGSPAWVSPFPTSRVCFSVCSLTPFWSLLLHQLTFLGSCPSISIRCLSCSRFRVQVDKLVFWDVRLTHTWPPLAARPQVKVGSGSEAWSQTSTISHLGACSICKYSGHPADLLKQKLWVCRSVCYQASREVHAGV